MREFDVVKYKDADLSGGRFGINLFMEALGVIAFAPLLLVWFCDLATSIKVGISIVSFVLTMIIVIFMQFLLSIFEIAKNTKETRNEVTLERLLLFEHLMNLSEWEVKLDKKGAKLTQQVAHLIDQVEQLIQQVTKPGPQETQVDRQVVEPEQQDANRPQRIPLPENRMGKWTRIKPIDLKFD